MSTRISDPFLRSMKERGKGWVEKAGLDARPFLHFWHLDRLASLAPTPNPSLAGRGGLIALSLGAIQLAGCGTKTADDALTSNKIACVSPGSQGLVSCTVERTVTANGTILTLRHPDGAFRRLLVARNGDITAADGAEQPRVTSLPANQIEVALGGARYRLPTPAHLAQAAR